MPVGHAVDLAAALLVLLCQHRGFARFVTATTNARLDPVVCEPTLEFYSDTVGGDVVICSKLGHVESIVLYIVPLNPADTRLFFVCSLFFWFTSF